MSTHETVGRAGVHVHGGLYHDVGRSIGGGLAFVGTKECGTNTLVDGHQSTRFYLHQYLVGLQHL